MSDEQARNSHKSNPPPKRRRRWLRRIAIVLTAPIVAYLLFRLLYPVWIEATLPQDAPRIAFSLDNSVLGRIGVTDATYQRVITAAGGRLITLRPNMAGDPEVDTDAVATLLDAKQIDGVLLTGGGDVDPKVYGGEPGKTMLVHRLRDDFEIALVHAARKRGLPILGICRGCQIINVALGGTVRNLRKEENVKGRHLALRGHAVDLDPNSTLAETLGVVRLKKAVSTHGQAVGEPGAEVRIAATGPGGVIEAIEADSADNRGWIVGLQWHPELRIKGPIQHKVFKVFVDRAAQVRDRRLSRRQSKSAD